MLSVEHVWMTGLRDAVMDAGGVTVARQLSIVPSTRASHQPDPDHTIQTKRTTT
jgi:hypothetical protein